MRIDIKAALLGVATSAFVLGLTFSLAAFLRTTQAADELSLSQAKSNEVRTVLNVSERVEQGHALFERNCAHCHGDDARGDEGPTLHNLAMSDTRIAQRIKNGIKGEMPKFSSKLNDTDIAALISWLRTLND